MGQVVVYPGEDGYWVVESPSLPGCVSQGKTHEEAIINIREAIKEYVAGLEEDELPVPGDRFEALLVAVWASCRGCPAVRAFARCSRLDSSPRDRRAATSFCAGAEPFAQVVVPETRNSTAVPSAQSSDSPG